MNQDNVALVLAIVYCIIIYIIVFDDTPDSTDNERDSDELNNELNYEYFLNYELESCFIEYKTKEAYKNQNMHFEIKISDEVKTILLNEDLEFEKEEIHSHNVYGAKIFKLVDNKHNIELEPVLVQMYEHDGHEDSSYVDYTFVIGITSDDRSFEVKEGVVTEGTSGSGQTGISAFYYSNYNYYIEFIQK